MFKKNDPYTFTKYLSLFQQGTQIGNLSLEYQVTTYDDVQLAGALAVTKAPTRKFLVSCTQRATIWNPSAENVSPGSNLTSFEDYPVMLNAVMSIQTQGLDFQLLDYSPRTVNTKIQSSGTQAATSGTGSSNTSSNTIGSSTAQTNSYGTSVSVGASGIGEAFSPNMSVTENEEHSSTTTQDQSATRGSESSSSRSNEISGSASMSMKDWGAYALVNPLTKTPAWTFGQEYPWDAVACRTTNGTVNPGGSQPSNQVQIIIPTEMVARLWDGVSLYPPSHLSTFGFDFVMKACWLVTIQDNTATLLDINHIMNYFSGSHMVENGSVTAYMDRTPAILTVGPNELLDTTLDLALMALAPLGGKARAAVIGFIPNKFIVRPAAPPAPPFEIISSTNDLMIKDTTQYPQPAPSAPAGFTSSQTALTATLSADIPTLQMTLYFKVIDLVDDYILFMKHWLNGSAPVTLTLVINGDESTALTKYVDSVEAEGGEKNLLSIALRNQDYASVDYHDYLQLGLNSIQITIAPAEGATAAPGCVYQMRAISIEQV